MKCWWCQCKTLFLQTLEVNLMSPTMVGLKISKNSFCYREIRITHQQ